MDTRGRNTEVHIHDPTETKRPYIKISDGEKYFNYIVLEARIGLGMSTNQVKQVTHPDPPPSGAVLAVAFCLMASVGL